MTKSCPTCGKENAEDRRIRQDFEKYEYDRVYDHVQPCRQVDNAALRIRRLENLLHAWLKAGDADYYAGPELLENTEKALADSNWVSK